jgi:transposase
MAVIKRNKILSFYHMPSLKEFIDIFYVKKGMSCGALQKRIKKDTGIKIGRETIWKWIRISGIKPRNQRIAFNLGVSRKRFSHKKVASKINYKTRDIDYDSVAVKRLKTYQGYKHRSYFAPRLKKMLLTKGKTHKQLAKILGVTSHCVYAWCALHNRINEIYWDKISAFLDKNIYDILDKRTGKILHIPKGKSMKEKEDTRSYWITTWVDSELKLFNQLTSTERCRNKIRGFLWSDADFIREKTHEILSKKIKSAKMLADIRQRLGNILKTIKNV